MDTYSYFIHEIIEYLIYHMVQAAEAGCHFVKGEKLHKVFTLTLSVLCWGEKLYGGDLEYAKSYICLRRSVEGSPSRINQ